MTTKADLEKMLSKRKEELNQEFESLRQKMEARERRERSVKHWGIFGFAVGATLGSLTLGVFFAVVVLFGGQS